MRYRTLRQIALPAILCANLAVIPGSAAGETAHGGTRPVVLAQSGEVRLTTSGGACGTDVDMGRRRLDDGTLLMDWVLLAGERLRFGDYPRLVVEAKKHLAEHCGWDRVARVMDAAFAGLAEEIEWAIARDARLGLERLARTETALGTHLALVRLRAHAHGLLGERRKEDRAYTEWLDAAASDHPDRVEVLKAQDRARAAIEAEGREADDAAFERARLEGDSWARKWYPMEFPTSRFASEAKARLRDLRARSGETGESDVVGRRFRDCEHCPEMVVVPAGSFAIGHGGTYETLYARVTIRDLYAVGVFEVTFDEWDACREAGGCSHDPGDEGWGRGSRPVVNVSWEDAQEYVRWLSNLTGITYRLLSESEWEHAARGGTRSKYSWGSGPGSNRANCAGCGSPWDGGRTAPAGSFHANPVGLHDVHGNVWEWAQDCWTTLSDPSGVPEGPFDATPRSVRHGGHCDVRVVRGGAWNSKPRDIRSAMRRAFALDERRPDVGFRVARVLQ